MTVPRADHRSPTDGRQRTEAERAAALEYWRRTLDGAPATLGLPFGLTPPATPGLRTGYVTALLNADVSAGVCELAASTGSDPAVAFLAAAGVCLARWTTHRDIVIGVFDHAVPVRLRLADDAALGEALARAQRGLASGIEHGHVSFDEIAAGLRLVRDPIFEVAFYDLSDTAGREFAGAPARPPFDLAFHLHRDSDRYGLKVVHAEDRYGREVAEALLDQWQLALAAMVDDLDRPITEFGARPRPPAPPASPALPAFADIGSLRDLVRTVLDQPRAATAIRVQGGQRYTYGWLHDAVEDASRLLRDRVPAGRAVAIAGRLHPLWPVAVLACWQNSLPAVLFDVDVPLHWQQQAFRETNAAAIVTLGWHRDTGVPKLDVVDRSPSPDAPEPAPFGHALLTSGSTGTPKVILLPADALPAAFAAYTEAVGLTATDVCCVVSSPGHDPVLRELLLPLALGASTVLPANPAVRFDPVGLTELLREHACTVLSLTPSHANQLTSANCEPLPAVRVVGSCGETLSDATARDLRRLAPCADVFNLYGTTETPQVSAVHRWRDPLDEPSSWRTARTSVPVGTGLGGRSVRVHTTAGLPASIGQLGEVVVAGGGLALGTDGSFRTGDLGRLTPDGEVEIHGRISPGGHRADPAAVEAALLAVDGVREVAVGVAPHQSDRLIALVVLDSHAPSVAELRDLLPSRSEAVQLVAVEAIPLTRNGKPDFAQPGTRLR